MYITFNNKTENAMTILSIITTLVVSNVIAYVIAETLQFAVEIVEDVSRWT